LRITTDPPGATLTVLDVHGHVVDTQTTPARLSLVSSSPVGIATSYKLVFSKPGFYDSKTWLQRRIGGWYYGEFPRASWGMDTALETSVGTTWAQLPAELIWNLTPHEMELGPEDLRVLQEVQNPRF